MKKYLAKLKEHGISMAKMGENLGVSRQNIHQVFNCTSRVYLGYQAFILENEFDLLIQKYASIVKELQQMKREMNNDVQGKMSKGGCEDEG